jgi:Raf kinase inhibitor-like YbhB/YbcL family protein
MISNRAEQCILRLLVVGLLGIVAFGCDDGDDYPALVVTSLAFGDGETIPARHTCDGHDISPPLSFSDIPDETVGFAVILDDPDAAAGRFTHWVIWGLPGGTSFVAEDQNRNAEPPITQGLNSTGKPGYLGPCPPEGEQHRYIFKAYALDDEVELDSSATRADLKSAMDGHIVGYGELLGLTRRPL